MRAGGTPTNLILQETAGAHTRLEIVFLNAAAGQVGGSSVVDLDAFASKRLDDIVPEGAVSAILTNRFDSAGKFSVIATPVDKARELDGSRKGGDTWVVADWPLIGGYFRNRPVIIPVAGIVRGANDSLFRTDVAIMNTNEYEATGELTFHPQGGTPSTRQLTLQRYESRVFENVLTSLFGVVDNQIGYLTFRPLAPAFANWLLTGRVFATVGNQVATFGTGVPAVDVGSAMGRGELRRFAGFDDSGDASLIAGRPATFRSNLGLVETTGHPVKVRVTLYNAVPGYPATQATVQPKIFELGSREFRLISRISREILGARRGEFRDDLRDLYLDVEVIEGEGKIIAFVSSVDNGTADQVLQIP